MPTLSQSTLDGLLVHGWTASRGEVAADHSTAAIFVLEYIATATGYGGAFNDFSLWPRAVLTLPAIWQLVTYMFLHDPRGFSHILFNMLALWMIGSDLERDWGTKLFLKFYFLCGVGAGVCVVLANGLVGILDARTIGSSGAVYGLLLAFGVLYSDRILLFGFLFPDQGQVLRNDPRRDLAVLGSFGPAEAASATWPTWAGCSSD